MTLLPRKGNGALPPDLVPILLNRLSDVLFQIGPNGRMVWISPNAERMFGYTVKELTGLEVSRLYARPDERPSVIERIAQSNGVPVRIELELRRKSGESIWVVIDACAVTDAQGRYTGCEGQIRDITEYWITRKTLKDSEDRFRRLSDVATEAICIHFQGKIIDMNMAFETLFGFGRAELLEMWAWDVIDPRDIALAKEKVKQQYEEPYEVRGVRKNGSIFPMEIYSKHSWLGEKSVRVTSIRDLTQRKQAEETVQLLSQAVEQSPVATAVLSAAGIVQYVNSAHSGITGFAASFVTGRPLAQLYGGKASASFGELWQSLVAGGEWRGEIHAKRADGSLHWQQIYASRVAAPSDTGIHFLILVEDITVRKEQEKRLQHQAMYDGLTNLPNRTQALDRLTHDFELARERDIMVALLFVDLDEFKSINDSLGHEYGDELLVLASERLRAAAGPNATVARFGGDEFLIIMGGVTDRSAVARVASEVVDRFAVPFTISRRDLIATASIGVALYPEDGRTPQILLRNADTAMYQAKLGGRNRWCFFTARMNEEAEARLYMESELRRAVGSEQLFLCYQPLVEVKTGRVIGVEALLRWKNPEMGLVPPDRFIPQAETSGLIIPIGRMVLYTACRAAKGWVDMGYPDLKVCVNVSPRQFQDAAFLDDIRAALRQSGLPPTNLELEITEGLLLVERGDVAALLHTLRDIGVQLSIDDFGTGYSSLSYLERFPFHTLKIDRSFMVGMLERHERKVLVETIVAMASGLGLKVIAEGVETFEQLSHLGAIGCDIAQGFLFSRPVVAEEIAALLGRDFLM
ncbi:Signal transduction protein [Candidatus Terasakiella magnetica]|nr:Signal transduction protein [Candidatus Terasakiella magnetica]